MTDTHATPALEYAPGAPLRRKRRLRRGALVSLTLILAIAGLWLGLGIWSKTVLLYHQRGCLRHAAPPEEVVFDSNPGRVALLGNDPNYTIAGGCAFRKPPADWPAVSQAATITPIRPSAVIFLHELKAGGISRLVEVERTCGTNNSPCFIRGYDIEIHSVIPAGFKQWKITNLTDDATRRANDIDVMDSIGPHLDIRIFAGQADPADPSHFTIRFESRGRTEFADGYLRADGKIEINVRQSGSQ